MNSETGDGRLDIEIKRIEEYDEALILKLFSTVENETIVPNPGFFLDRKNVLLVAFAENEPAGFLYGYVLTGIKRPDPKMFLYSIDVFAVYQRKGVGTLLLAALKQIAIEYKCREIFVVSNKSNEAAVALYTKTGGKFEAEDDVVFVYTNS